MAYTTKLYQGVCPKIFFRNPPASDARLPGIQHRQQPCLPTIKAGNTPGMGISHNEGHTQIKKYRRAPSGKV